MEEMVQQCTQMMNSMAGMMGGGMMGNGMMIGGAAGWASPWYWLGWVWVLALLTLIIIACVWTIRSASRPPQVAESSLEILKRRFARGEIPPEQFETMKRQLSES